jgi:GNAT superfamily N-acetyltransferase
LLSNIEIRPLAESDSLEELTGLLHRAYKKQADRGLRFLASHQDVSVTKQRIEEGECYVGILKNKIVATITYSRHPHKDACEWDRQPHVATYGQFAVEPELQNTGIGNKLMLLMEDLAKRDRVRELSVNTSEQAEDLISFYKKRGYREVGQVKWPVVNYRSVILSKAL